MTLVSKNDKGSRCTFSRASSACCIVRSPPRVTPVPVLVLHFIPLLVPASLGCKLRSWLTPHPNPWKGEGRLQVTVTVPHRLCARYTCCAVLRKATGGEGDWGGMTGLPYLHPSNHEAARGWETPRQRRKPRFLQHLKLDGLHLRPLRILFSLGSYSWDFPPKRNTPSPATAILESEMNHQVSTAATGNLSQATGHLCVEDA